MVVTVGKEQPRAREVTSPGENTDNEERVKGERDVCKTTWADVVKRHTSETKVETVYKKD